MTVEEYIHDLYYEDRSIQQINVLVKLFSQYNLNLLYLDKDTEVSVLRTLFENCKEGTNAYKDFLFDLTKDNEDILLFNNTKLSNVEKYEIFDLIKDMLDDDFKIEQVFEVLKNDYDDNTIEIFLNAISDHIVIGMFLGRNLTSDKLLTCLDLEKAKILPTNFDDYHNKQLQKLLEINSYNQTVEKELQIDIHKINEKFSEEQIDAIIKAYKMCKRKMDFILDPGWTCWQIHAIYTYTHAGVDMEKYCTQDMSVSKMECIARILTNFSDKVDKIDYLFKENYNHGQMYFLAYCIANDIQIDEFKNPKYTMGEMIQIARFIHFNRDKVEYNDQKVMDLETFKRLTIQQKSLVDSLFYYNKIEKIPKINFDDFSEQTILDNLFDTSKNFTRLEIYEQPSLEYAEEGFLQLANGHIAKLEFDRMNFNNWVLENEKLLHVTKLNRITENFLEDKFDFIAEIYQKTSYLDYDPENESFNLYTTVRMDDKGQDFCYENLAVESAEQFFNYCFGNFYKENIVFNYEYIITHAIISLAHSGMFSINDTCIVENVNNFNKFGFTNFNNEYYYSILSDMWTQVYIKKEEFEDFVSKKYNIFNEDELTQTCLEIFKEKIRTLEDLMNGNSFLVTIYDGEYNEINEFYCIGDYYTEIEMAEDSEIVYSLPNIENDELDK